MVKNVFSRRTRITVPAQEVYDWHAREGAFERLVPPWEDVRVVSRTGGLCAGARLVLSFGAGPHRLTWVAEHTEVDCPRRFVDVQLQGPFASWVHEHCFEPDGSDACFLQDRVEYELPLGGPFARLAGPLIEEKLRRTFAYRHDITANDLAVASKSGGVRAMRVLVSGAGGLIGSALCPFLTTQGHEVVRLVRKDSPSGHKEIAWDPENGRLDADALVGFDAVVHLAGDGIASERWTPEKKARIRKSRVEGTKLLCERLAALPDKPKVLVSASAIGYYGDRGDDILLEASPCGKGFLSEVCKEWEAATQPAKKAGIRVVKLRIGVVLSPRGGALAKMLTPFSLGLGGIIGNGRQYMSWISIDDVVGVILHALTCESLDGAVNAVAPNAVTNEEFTLALGAVLKRPTILPVPDFGARLAFGEMADELLLASTRVDPARLISTHYGFRHREIEDALRHVLGKDKQ